MSRSGWIALAAAAVVLGLVDPVLSPFLPACPFHALTGLHCPGCGSTRAMHALFTGHPLQAAGYNVLAVAALPVLLVLLVRRPPLHRLHQGWIIALLAVIILFGILRNIPWFPFTLLAP